jgi:hypothetical protein
MTNVPTSEGTDTKDEANDPSAVVTRVNLIALAILVAGSLLDRFAGVDSAYLISRAVAAPILVVALVLGVRRRAGRALIWPSILLALVATTLVIDLA